MTLEQLEQLQRRYGAECQDALVVRIKVSLYLSWWDRIKLLFLGALDVTVRQEQASRNIIDLMGKPALAVQSKPVFRLPKRPG